MSDDKRISYSTLMKRAEMLANRGKIDESLKCYDKALEFAPSDVAKYSILQLMAKQLESKKRYDEVIEVCNKALGFWSWDDRWRERKELAIMKRDKDKLKVLQTKYEKEFEKYYLKQLSLLNKGNDLLDLGKHVEAIKCFDIMSPKIGLFLYGQKLKLDALIHLKKYEEVLKLGDSLLEIVGDHRGIISTRNYASDKLNKKRWEEEKDSKRKN